MGVRGETCLRDYQKFTNQIKLIPHDKSTNNLVTESWLCMRKYRGLRVFLVHVKILEM